MEINIIYLYILLFLEYFDRVNRLEWLVWFEILFDIDFYYATIISIEKKSLYNIILLMLFYEVPTVMLSQCYTFAFLWCKREVIWTNIIHLKNHTMTLGFWLQTDMK